MARVRYVIRTATRRDIPELVRQRRLMFEAMEEGDPLALARADRDYARWVRAQMAQHRLVAFLVAKQATPSAIVAGGTVWLQERQPRPGFAGGGVPYLMSMYTDPRCRRQGLASLIIGAAVAWCRAHGHTRLSLHASPAGRSLYRALGWKRTQEYSRAL